MTEGKPDDELQCRGEGVLQANETLLRQFVINTPAAVAMFDREVRYLLYSKRWLTDYKLGDRDLTGLSHYEVFPDVPERWKEIHQRVLTGKVERCQEDKFVRADGSIEWIRWEVHPWSNKAGEIGGIIMFTEVITERKRTETALQESESKYRLLFENMTAGFALHEMIYDEQGRPFDYRYLEVNPAFEKLTGVRVADLMGKTVRETMPDTEQYWIDVYGKVAQTGEPISYQNYARELDRYYDCWAFSPRRGQFAVVFTDVSKRKRAEEALRAKTEELDLFFSIALDLLCIADTDGYFRLLNPAWERTLGYSRNELEGRRFFDFVHPDDLPATLKAVADLSTGKAIIDFTNRFRCSDGSYRWLEWRSKPYKNKLIYAAARDITQRKHSDEEKRQFYRDTIRSITQGKLSLVSFHDVKKYIDCPELTINVKSPADTTVARHKVVEFCVLNGLTGNRMELFETAVGEAITNAIKHANEGEVYAGVREDSIWVAVSDNGPGISALMLPGATLRRGFSTKTSMGMGYSIMMEASDSILLCTGAQGTAVVLTIDTAVTRQALSLDDLPDTWGAIPST